MIFLLFKFLIGLVLIIFFVGVLRTWRIQHDPLEKIFLGGIIPNLKPDGLYQGNFIGHKVSWRGKNFNAVNSTGINIFDNEKGGQVEKYPFTTSVGKGLLDKNINVLKIDYNVKGNPFWLRLILDEIVEVTPNKYLGKMHIKIIPGFPFSILYFELRK